MKQWSLAQSKGTCTNEFSWMWFRGDSIYTYWRRSREPTGFDQGFVHFRKLTDHLSQQRQKIGFEGWNFGMERWLGPTCNRRAIILIHILEGHNQFLLAPWLVVPFIDQFQTNQEGKGDKQLSIDIGLQGPIADKEEQALVMGVGIMVQASIWDIENIQVAIQTDTRFYPKTQSW